MTRPGRVAWVAVLALPALALCARMLLDAHDEDLRARPERDRAAAAPDVAVWTAAGDLAGLGRVAVRVAPLHADPTRQAFEAGALRARVDGLAGEPYLVQIEIERGPPSAARLDPATVRVEDDAGTALAAPAIPASNDPDPVATLLRPPAPIAAGERVSFVLFGREPAAGARFLAADGASLALEPHTRDAGAPDLPIASIDRRTPPTTEGGQ